MRKPPAWAPRLAEVHPGYFKVVLALLLTHLALGIDALRVNPDTSHAFKFVASALHGQFWILTVAHFVVFALILIGLYGKGLFHLLRFGSALSAVIFNALAVAFAFAAVDYDASFFAAILSVALSLSSIAAAKEPETGPGGVAT